MNANHLTIRPDYFAPTGNDTYCVPFAIAAASGLSYKAVEDLIRRIRGQEAPAKVAGVKLHHWYAALQELFDAPTLKHCDRRTWTANFSDHDEYCDLGPTLARWHRELTADEHAALKVVRVRGHVILVQGDSWCDNSTKGWLPMDAHPKRRMRVDFFVSLPKEVA